MDSWLVTLPPFVVLGVILLLYFFIATGGRSDRRLAMKNDINYYLVCVLAMAIISIAAGLSGNSVRDGNSWLTSAVWPICLVAIAAVVWRFMTGSSVDNDDGGDSGPLG